MKPQFLDSNDPSMIRAWNRRSTTRRHARSQNLFSAFHTRRFRWLTQCFVHRLSPKDCTYPEKWQAKLTKYCNYHEECHSNFTKYYNENPSSYTGKFSTNLLWQVKHNVLLYVYIFFVCVYIFIYTHTCYMIWQNAIATTCYPDQMVATVLANFGAYLSPDACYCMPRYLWAQVATAAKAVERCCHQPGRSQIGLSRVPARSRAVWKLSPLWQQVIT